MYMQVTFVLCVVMCAVEELQHVNKDVKNILCLGITQTAADTQSC